MYTVTKQGTTYTVTETIHGWFGSETRYYRFCLVSRMRSCTGKKDALTDTVMSQREVEWAEKYYVPKAVEIPEELLS